MGKVFKWKQFFLKLFFIEYFHLISFIRGRSISIKLDSAQILKQSNRAFPFFIKHFVFLTYHAADKTKKEL